MDFLTKYSSQILGLTRIIVGLLFLEHGLMKLVGFPAAMGTPPLPPLMLAAGIIEVVGGGLVTLGLFSRFAAFICSGVSWAAGAEGWLASDAGGLADLLHPASAALAATAAIVKAR